jgi:uncharacterized membrane protein
MKNLPLQFVILLIVVCVTVPSTVVAQSGNAAVVRAVLFYSPACSHCHHVIDEVLVPMVNEYGDQLQIAGIDISQPGGSQLYHAAIGHYQIPDERRGVPTLVVDDVVLVGSGEIPEQFPTLFEEGLAAGGIDWPDIPGLAEILSAAEAEPSPTAASPATATPVTASATVPPATTTPLPSPTATSAPPVLTVGEDEILSGEAQEPPPDPLGFTLAGVVLAGMVVACCYAAGRFTLAQRRPLRLNGDSIAHTKTWAVPLLALMGLGVAAYLAYVEVKHVEAVCGPVGECNIVQGSDYALLLGIPVAVWGVLNYLAIGVLWAGQRYLTGRWANLSALGLLGLTSFGTLFSIYLTCLELFVVRAICAWCLSSAVITTLIMLLVVIPTTDGLSLEISERVCG